MKWSLLLLGLACGPDLSQVPDAGSACSCNDEGWYWYVYDDYTKTTQPIMVCRFTAPPPPCVPGGTKANACDGGIVIVLGGGPDCTWERP